MLAGAFVSCGNSKSSESGSDTGAKVSCSGKWEWDTKMYLDIDSEGVIRMAGTIPGTSMMSFNSDGTGTAGGTKFGPGQFDFDGETYRLHVSSDDDVTLKRLEPNDGTEFFGRYRMVSGKLYDSIESGYNKRASEKGSDEKLDRDSIDIQLEIDEDGTDIDVRYVVGDIVSDDTLSITIGDDTFGGTYSVEGDVMTIHTDSGNSKELRRIK